MRYAANISLLYPDLGLLDRPAAAAADGFDGVEILFPYDIDRRPLRAALDRAGLPAVLVNTPTGSAHERGLAAVDGATDRFREQFRIAVQAATELGAPRIHTMAGLVPSGGEARARATLVDNLRWAADHAVRYGLTLTLEALNRRDVPGYCYHKPGQAVEVLQDVERPNIGLQFDLYHVAMEALPVVAELDAARPWIRHCQIAGPPDRGEPTEQDRELLAAVARLDATGYDGWLGFEYRPRGDTSAGLSWRDLLAVRPS